MNPIEAKKIQESLGVGKLIEQDMAKAQKFMDEVASPELPPTITIPKPKSRSHQKFNWRFFRAEARRAFKDIGLTRRMAEWHIAQANGLRPRAAYDYVQQVLGMASISRAKSLQDAAETLWGKKDDK